MPDKPFFVYFAPGATHAPHHVPQGVDRQVPGTVRRRLGRPARTHLRPAEGARRHPRGRRADRAARRDPRVGRHARGAQAGPGAADGGVRRVPRAHRPPRRPADRRARDLEVLDDTIVYYIIGDNGASAEGTVNGPSTRWPTSTGWPRSRRPSSCSSKMDDFGGEASYSHYSVGWAWAMNTPAPVDQAGRLALGWHPQRHHRALAERHRGARWRAVAVHPRDRPGTDHPRGRRPPRADHGQRRAPGPHGRHQHAVRLQRRGRRGTPRPPVLRDVRQPRDLPQGVERGHQAPHPVGDGRRRGP